MEYYNMMKKVLFLITFLGVTFGLSARQSSFFTHYSSEDGLSQNTVMGMLQDRKGNLWFSTWDGINRFNGYAFKTYKARQGNYINLTNNRVDRIYEDSNGFLWLFTYDNRAHRFNPLTETFEQVPAADQPGSNFNISTISVLPNGVVWLLTENDGAMRVVTDPADKHLTTKTYSVKSGLFPATKVYKVHQDKKGNEWMLTDNGLGMLPAGEENLNSYFVETKERFTDPKQAFYTIQEGTDEIWFGSDRGRVWRYLKNKDRFELLELPTSARISSINSISPTEMIVATDKDGFFTYDLTQSDYNHYKPYVYPDFTEEPILSTYVDRTGEVWFEQETPGRVLHFNPHTKTLKAEQIRVEPTAADRSRPSFHIHEDVNGYLWVHPYAGGFSRFDRKQNKLVPFYNELGSPEWRFSNKIHSSFSDKQGNLWMSTHSKGLEKVTFRSVQFNMLTPEVHDYESLANEVRALCEDKNGNIWVGLKDGRLRIYDRDLNYLGVLTEQGQISKTGTSMKGTVYDIRQDKSGDMWIATKGDGLVHAKASGRNDLSFNLSRYRYNKNDMYSLSSDNVYSIFEDKNGRIWVATFANGINYLSKDANGNVIFVNHRNNLKGYPIDQCYKARIITSDNKGHLWVGTTAGAVAFDEDFQTPEAINFHLYQRTPDDTKSLSNNDVHWILSTRKNELYFGTFGGGLNKLLSMDNEGNAVFKSFSVLDGLPSDVLLSIREDKKGNLWISTENGISKFMPHMERFDNYDDRSITFRVRFSEAASTVTSQGEMLFGASNGVFYFHPDSVNKSRFVPPIVFSKLVIANKEIVPGDESVLSVGLDDTDVLKLSHKANVFTINYAALDYTNPQNIQYAYILEGFENEWTLADKLRSATYTNLPKGHYTFKVRSTNSDGVWVENTRMLPIEILPSFWETPLAYFLYVLFVLIVIFVAVYFLFIIYRLKHEVSVEQQVSDIKLRFFTNISHELRTPLTLISGPVEHILQNSNLSTDVREQLVVVERNTNRMLRLVNQILDFRKIQNKKMKMQVERINIIDFIRKVMGNFESLAEEHNIDFLLEAEKDDLYLWADSDKLEKIVFNLLSNAFKYTPNGKLIKVFVREDEKTISIGVQDQGIGIAENRKKSLFVRFENLVDKNLFNHVQASTGIGLSLVKELVEMHHATIKVDSKLGEGSCFEIDFLKGKEHYSDGVEFFLDDSELAVSQLTPVQGVVPEQGEELSKEEANDSDGATMPLMLLVEDNQELSNFLRTIFSSSFRVIQAKDGMEGWSKALKFVPDFIISDLMMPEKDGIELVRELRADMTTSHIPIVLLTAKTSIESKLEGLEMGADDYITKPFSATYLKARVENLLEQRQKLQHIYRDNLMNNGFAIPALNDEEVLEEEDKLPEMSPNDRRFMDKLVELMERNMDNGDLVVDDLVREVAVSRSVFFKKLKTITGLAPIEFIKEMRINRAVQLIETGEFNMTQISYMVGINDPRYFSKCFKAKMGMTPTEYRDNVVKK